MKGHIAVTSPGPNDTDAMEAQTGRYRDCCTFGPETVPILQNGGTYRLVHNQGDITRFNQLVLWFGAQGYQMVSVGDHRQYWNFGDDYSSTSS